MDRGGFTLGLTLGFLAGAAVVSSAWLILRESGGSQAPSPAPAPRTGAGATVRPAPEPLAMDERPRSASPRPEPLGIRPRSLPPTLGRPPGDDGGSPLELENAALRNELRALRGTLRTETAMRTSQEGSAIGFPKELPLRYHQEAVVAAVTEALRTAGMPGEIRSVDCSEYPCLVYGESKLRDPTVIAGHLRKGADVLRKSYPNEQDVVATSYWSADGKDPATPGLFGVAIFPHPPDGEDDAALRRRMRFRQSQYVDSARGK